MANKFLDNVQQQDDLLSFHDACMQLITQLRQAEKLITAALTDQ